VTPFFSVSSPEASSPEVCAFSWEEPPTGTVGGGLPGLSGAGGGGGVGVVVAGGGVGVVSVVLGGAGVVVVSVVDTSTEVVGALGSWVDSVVTSVTGGAAGLGVGCNGVVVELGLPAAVSVTIAGALFGTAIFAFIARWRLAG
jgi:hypothetical protein